MRFLDTSLVGSVGEFVIALVVISGTTLVDACNGGHFRYGHYGTSADFSHLDNLDASQHPTLSEKIRTVISSHYGHGWTPVKSTYHSGQSGGGQSYSHIAGGEDHGHHHSTVSSQNGWSNQPGYEFAAHNHQKPVVVSPEESKPNYVRRNKHRKFKVKLVKQPK